jgi:hypothetical protein
MAPHLWVYFVAETVFDDLVFMLSSLQSVHRFWCSIRSDF